ncbi:2OG-Fe(II) oxygenase superfamily-domain containing protein [Nitzschia inconspicua]|uniref:2OG-Fe(II) oxygenase superfamily-domain containing protein n=1 Tax=Nitzschia inconspicua TaxID=303405 RepID=A0A9K3KLL0_9STRA|nr:2OG-Fe(II) oxygenase superfamily-domain containing protein [Nitzschia inconspicua]
MEAIDFKKLLLEERKKSKKRSVKPPCNNDDDPNQSRLYTHQQDDDATTNDGLSTSPKAAVSADPPLSWQQSTKRKIPTWSYPPGFLSLKAVALKIICDDPPTISYSSTSFLHHPSNDQSSGTTQSARSSIDPINNSKSNEKQVSPSQALETWLARIPSGDSGIGEWKTMSFGKRRVCMFVVGEPQETTSPSAQRTSLQSSSSLPPPLEELAQELVEQGIFAPETRPNHVLLNEYQPGQGIMPHTDGPAYYSRTATLSLCSPVVMEFTPRQQQQQTIMTETSNKPMPPLQVLLEPSSLLVFQDDAYLEYCHGIPMDVWQDTTTDHCLNTSANQTIHRGFRYSLTFRHKKETCLER